MVDSVTTRSARSKSYRWVGVVAILAVVGAMALDTTVVEIGSVHASVVSLECSELPFRW